MKPLDAESLLACAGDQSSRALLEQIFRWREEVAARNEFSRDNRRFTITLHELPLDFKVSNAFSAIETFHEIFILNNHCRLPEFLPEHAGTVLDVGANQGFYALRMAQANPACRICCFEPNPFEFESLLRNLSANAMTDRVSAWNLALAATSGDLDLEVIPEIGPIGGASLRNPARTWLREEFIRRITVKAVSLEEALRRSGFDRVDILKVDVEGLELEILGSFRAFEAVERIVVEYHSAAGRSGLLTLLAGQGFTLLFEDAEPGDSYGDLYFGRKRPE